jgi:hypothetical protein
METTDQETGVDPFDALLDSIGNGREEDATAPSGEEEPTQPTDEEAAPQQTDEVAAEAADVIEFDGKKLEIPQGTPPALVQSIQSMAADLKADYTRKTQEVAEIRKATDARSNAIQQQEEMLSANVRNVAELTALQQQLAQFEQLDWQAIAETDPGQATKLNLRYQQLQREAGTKYRELQQADQKRQQLQAVAKDEAMKVARVELAKRLPKIDEATRQQMLKAATDDGWTESHLENPALVHALHDAIKWRKLQADKPKALQKVAEAPRVLKPGTAAQPTRNQAAFDRLKKTGRIEDLAALL